MLSEFPAEKSLFKELIFKSDVFAFPCAILPDWHQASATQTYASKSETLQAGSLEARARSIISKQV